MDIIHIVLGKANPERMNGVNKVVYELTTKQVEIGLKASVWGITKDKEKNYGERNFETLLFLHQRNPFAISKEMKLAFACCTKLAYNPRIETKPKTYKTSANFSAISSCS